MTGFNSKQQMAADKLQEPYDQTALELCNVCGWKTLIPDDGCLNCERAQPAQEPPPWWPAVENILTEYGLQAIDFVADFKEAMKDAPQRPWVGLTELKERNNG